MTTLFLLSQPYPENLYYIDDPGKIQEKGDFTNAYFPYKKVNIIYKSVLLLKKPINNLLVHLNKRRALNFDCLVRTTIFFLCMGLVMNIRFPLHLSQSYVQYY